MRRETWHCYRFFDVEALIRADSRAILDRFQRIYSRFQVTRPAGPTFVCEVISNGRAAGGPAVVVDGCVHPVANPDLLFDYAHTTILNAVFARVAGHFLIHAAALSWPGRDGDWGLILAAAADVGKTTLALALVQRGFRFLSDDVAAIGCADGLLYPFPRSPAIRPATWRLCGLGAEQPTRQWVDVAALFDDCIGTPCPPRVLILLDDGRGEAEGKRDGLLYLTVDRLPAGLEKALERLSGVESATVLARRPATILALRPRPGCRPDEGAIQRTCEAHGILLFDVAKGPPVRPDFASPPRLAPLSPSAAALALLARLRGGERSALLQRTFGGRPARLYAALASITGRMKCFRLTIGRLAEMVDLIHDAVSGFR